MVLSREEASGVWGEARDLPGPLTLHERFLIQADERPEAMAVMDAEGQLTYGELKAQALALAWDIRARDIAPGSLIGVCMDRSARVITAVLGTLLAGCAYVPLDPSYPAGRLRDMTVDTRSPLILTRSAYAPLFEGLGASVGLLDQGLPGSGGPPVDLTPVSGRDSPAYVIYTSGSTGKPKGVVCRHGGVLNLLSHFQAIQPLNPGDRCSWWTSLNFDVSVYEIFSSLMDGGTLVIVPEAMRPDGPRFMTWLSENRIMSAYVPPFMVPDLLEWTRNHPGGSVLRRLLVGVEPIPERILVEIQNAAPGLRIINGYGPTETTVCATLYPISPNRPLHDNTPIGRPVQNTVLYILDEDRVPVPQGTDGELYIGGAGVALGYWNRPDLTAERFVPNPFVPDPTACLYKTGDRVRLEPDGNIEFLGRTDFQIKFRGFRIEPGEIETALRSHGRVRDAVVMLREDRLKRPHLTAYVTPHDAKPLLVQDLRDHLKALLPEYLIPTAFVVLDRLPVTPNGKTDRTALPSPEPAGGGGRHMPAGAEARTPLEAAVIGFFQEILGAVAIGVNDSFFDLGGHSLLATRLVSRIRDVFGRDLSVRTVFEAPTPASLAREIEALDEGSPAADAPPLEPVADRSPSPLSFSQLRVWYLDQLEPGTPAYNINLAYRMTGPLQILALKQAFDGLIARHRSLRTVFQKQGGQPVQTVLRPRPLSMEMVDLTHLPESGREPEARMLTDRECHRGFDLTRGPLCRVLLLRMGPEAHVMALTVHHIISDGWSMGVLIRELMALYQGAVEGRSVTLTEQPVQYTDVARWQRVWVGTERMKAQIAYWVDRFRSLPEPLDLPLDHPRPAVQSYRGASETLFLDQVLCDRLKSLAREQGVTLFMVLLAGFKALLYRYTHQDDLCVGTFIANRNRSEVEGLVGFFINSLALRTHLEGNPSFEDLLQRVKETALGAYAHQDLPFERLLEEIQPERSLSRTPVFQVMMVLQNMPLPPLALTGLQCEPMELKTFRSNFELTLWCYETGGEIKLVLEYATDLFEPGAIQGMLHHLRNLLTDACDRPQTKLSSLAMLSPSEKERLLEVWSGRRAAHGAVPEPVCVHRWIEEQARQRPSHTALEACSENGGPPETQTYQALNQNASRLARYLVAQGAGPDKRVSVLMHRSPLLITGLLAIHKAGAAYVPLDPRHPPDRNRFILTDTESPILLTDQTHRTLARSLVGPSVTVICMDDIGPEPERLPAEALTSSADPHHLAYVIYTSGSTGMPKGVLIEHHSLAAFTRAALSLYGFTPKDRVLQFASPTFDASVEEIFTTLAAGATLVLRSEAMIRTFPQFVQACTDLKVTVLDLPSAFWHAWVENMAASSGAAVPDSLRMVIIGGEEARADRVAQWQRRVGPRVRLINTYGPTEATVVATAQEIQDLKHPMESVPIGRPLGHVAAYVLDPEMALVPPGAAGELCLGGEGLARGYLNRPDVNRTRFVPSPFHRGKRLYRTGDRVRYLPDGSLAFLGRVDRQVKVRGFRVEPGEIESALNGLPGVSRSAVTAGASPDGSVRLAAYVVPEPGRDLDAAGIRLALSGALPDFMVPSEVVFLDTLPLTPGGKVDLRALPAPDARDCSDVTAAAGPRNPIEEVLVRIWEEVFDRQPIGIRDDFFHLGGHSLLSLQIIDRVNQAGLWLTPSQFMQHPTIEGLAQVVRTARPDANEGWMSLVELQPYGQRTPIFFLHSTPGDVLGYMNLVHRLGPEQPCYGFQSLGLRDRAHSRVEEMAAFYLKELRAFRPSGPYLLAGWCYGGIVAAEMAVPLEREGHDGAVLFLFETPFPRTETFAAAYQVDRLLGLARMGPKGWLSYARNRYRYWQNLRHGAMDRLFSLELAAGPLVNRSHVYRMNQEAVQYYRMSRTPRCPIRLFNGEELAEGYIPDPQNLWVRTGRDVRSFKVPGNHLTILREPWVDRLTETLEASLQEMGYGKPNLSE